MGLCVLHKSHLWFQSPFFIFIRFPLLQFCDLRKHKRAIIIFAFQVRGHTRVMRGELKKMKTKYYLGIIQFFNCDFFDKILQGYCVDY